MAFADFDALDVRPPSVGSKPKVTAKVLEWGAGDNYEVTSPDGINHIRESWPLTWPNIPASERNLIVDFLYDQGGYKPFTWTPPGETTARQWRCVQWEKGSPRNGRYTVTANFTEDFTP